MRIVVAGLVVILAIGVMYFGKRSPDFQPERTEAENAQMEAGVRQELTDRMEAYMEAATAGDVEAVMSFMTRDAWYLQPGFNMAGSELRAFMEEMYPSMTLTALHADMLELFVHGDAAYGIYEFSETVQMEGQEPESLILNCFTRWEKEDGVWKVDRDVCGPRDAPPEG